MKNNTFADFFFPLNPNFVEDDKSKIKRLEQELNKYKMDNERLTEKYENVQSENFALKIQLREYSLQNVTTKKSFPSFAEVAIKPLSDTNQSFSRTMPKSPPLKVKTSKPFVKLQPLLQSFPIPPVSQPKLSQQDSIHPEIVKNYAKPIKPKQELPSKNQSKNSKSIPLFAEKNSFQKKQNPKNSFNPLSAKSTNAYPNQNPGGSHSSIKKEFNRVYAKNESALPSSPRQSKTYPQKNQYLSKTETKTQNVIVYHDSNLAWSLPSTVEQAVKNIKTYGPHPIKEIKVTKNYTPRLEDTLNAIKSTNHSNSIVVLSVMTNNAKSHQSPYKSKSLLSEIVEHLKGEVSVKNIIVLESPPSCSFNIFPYNKAMFDLCQNTGIFFSRNLVKQVHLKADGLHILNQYKHLMIKSVAAAIKKVDPKSHYGFPRHWYNS